MKTISIGWGTKGSKTWENFFPTFVLRLLSSSFCIESGRKFARSPIVEYLGFLCSGLEDCLCFALADAPGLLECWDWTWSVSCSPWTFSSRLCILSFNVETDETTSVNVVDIVLSVSKISWLELAPTMGSLLPAAALGAVCLVSVISSWGTSDFLGEVLFPLAFHAYYLQ